MKKESKSSLKSGLVSGIIFSGIMALFYYHKERDFNIWTFLFNFLFYGTAMALLARYYEKKDEKK